MASSVVAEAKERVLFSFDKPDSAKPWQTVNDGVMGGRSVDRFKINEDKKMEFFGTLSLKNNGGFASVRARGGKLGSKTSHTHKYQQQFRKVQTISSCEYPFLESENGSLIVAAPGRWGSTPVSRKGTHPLGSLKRNRNWNTQQAFVVHGKGSESSNFHCWYIRDRATNPINC